jgi:hypothetical protein
MHCGHRYTSSLILLVRQEMLGCKASTYSPMPDERIPQRVEAKSVTRCRPEHHWNHAFVPERYLFVRLSGVRRNVLERIMRTEEGNNRASDISSGPGATTAGAADERADGSQSTDQATSSVLHPEVTFGASPYAHMLHVLAFVVCSLASIAAMIAQLPLKTSTSWWPVFTPQLLFPAICITFHGYCILPWIQKRAIRMQLGETPNPSTTVSGPSISLPSAPLYDVQEKFLCM